MNKFVIASGLPYLLHAGKTYAVKWDEKGFHVGGEVKVDFLPGQSYSEREIKAKCAVLDSMSKRQEEKAKGRKKATE